MNRYVSPHSRLQVLQQVDDLRLDRDVQRRDRLVADDEVRVQRERAGDADPLALAAGELVRVAVAASRGQPDYARAAGDRARRRLAGATRWGAAARRRSGRPTAAD